MHVIHSVRKALELGGSDFKSQQNYKPACELEWGTWPRQLHFCFYKTASLHSYENELLYIVKLDMHAI